MVYLLLALLYMDHEEYDKAYPVLKRVTQIDHGNTQAQRYLREITRIKKQKGSKTKSRAKDDIVRYERDNEIIIQPAQVVEPNTSKGALAGFVIGFLLGAAILFFLVLPGRIEGVRSEAEERIRIANEDKEAQAATITALESQISVLTQERDAVIAQYGNLYGDASNEEAVNALLGALQAYLSNASDLEGIKTHMDICVQNEAFYESNNNSILNLYTHLKALTSPGLAEHHYQAGYAAYQAKDYEGAVTELELAVMYYDQNADSLFYLASTYQALEKKDKAKEVFNIVVERFPGTSRANQANRALNNMTQQ